MKRSRINEIIHDAEAFIADCNFLLPPVATWSAADWERQDGQLSLVKRSGIGWDITDFNKGDFDRFGLVLFTLRNGLPPGDVGTTIPYAEKLLVSRQDQITLMHYHKCKTEDIIVRGGSPLAVRLYNLDPSGQLDKKSPVSFRMDGISHEIPAGDTVIVPPGESITLVPYCAHAFWGHGGTSLVGEVSSVNDDKTDNFFFEDLSRSPSIEEDEPPYRLIVPDYLV